MSIGAKNFTAAAVFSTGFLVLGFSNGLGMLIKGRFDGGYIARWQSLDCGTGFAASLLLAFTYPYVVKRLNGWRLISAAAALCYVSGVLWRLAGAFGAWQLGFDPKLSITYALLFVRGGLMDGTTLGLLSFVYFGIEHYRQAAEQREKARQATALAHQAQLQMLRYQLNPHFLFNALNSIRGMIIENPARSREMVTELADFLRYSLDSDEQGGTIGDEIRAIESYLAIQRIRFDEQLDATLQAEESTLSVAIPCFLIHPLVENAVKYGMKTSAMPLRIRVEVAREGDEIRIGVSNSGRLVENGAGGSESTGIGLKNIAERLKLVFPGSHSFKIWESDGWVRAEIRLKQVDQNVPDEISYSVDRG